MSKPNKPQQSTVASTNSAEQQEPVTNQAAPQASTNDPTASTAQVTQKLSIQGPEHGRWRLGRKFGPVPQELALTKEEFDVIQGDPFLKIVS